MPVLPGIFKKPLPGRVILCLLIMVSTVLRVTAATAEDSVLADVFKAFQEIEAKLQTDTEQETFARLLDEARTQAKKIQGDDKYAGCDKDFDRAVDAYEIINEIWRLQEHDNTIDAGYACVAVDKYELWLKSFPALLTWKWGKTGVGVTPLAEARFEPFNCCLILKPWLDDVWAPCLFNEARLAIRRAVKCLDRPAS